MHTMYKVIAEPHCHTLVSHHAYSTIGEYAADARSKGIEFVAITDHGPLLPDGAHLWHFDNLYKAIPEQINGVYILRGAEANIVSHEGALDIDATLLSKLDWVIASYHPDAIEPGTKSQHTKCWEMIAENPHVDVIGHCGDPRFGFDHEVVCKAFAKHGKIVEINNHSPLARPGSFELCVEIIKACGKYGVPVVVTTDAHHVSKMGIYDEAFKVLEASGIDKALVLNLERDRFAEKASAVSGRAFPLK